MRTFALFPIALLLLSCADNQAAENTMNVDATLTEDNLANATEDSIPKQPCAAIDDMLATVEDCEDLTALQKDVKSAPAALDAPTAMVRGKTYEVTLVIDRPKKVQAPPKPATQTCPDGTVIAATEGCPPPPPPPLPPPPPPDPGLNEATNASDSVVNMSDVVGNMADVVEPAAGSRDDETVPATANEVVAELPGQDTPFEAQVGRYMTAELTGSGFDIRLISPAEPMQVIPRGGQGRWQWEVVPKMGGLRRLTVKTQAVGIVDGKPVPLGNGNSSQDVQVKVSWPDRIWDALTAAPAWIKAVTAVLVALAALGAAWVPIRKWFRKSPRK